MNRVQFKKSKKKREWWYNKQIAITIPTTTKGLTIRGIADLPFFKIMLPSFLKTSSGKCYYNFYLGYDYDDSFLSQPSVARKIEELFNKIVSDNKRYTLKIVSFPDTFEKGDLSSMWSYLSDMGMKDGNEYFYQLGDDIQFLEIREKKEWESIFINSLLELNNIGSVGPYDNSKKILTQSFVHATHLSIWGRYFPKELKNWYVDDWITEVYSSRPDKRFRVINSSNHIVRYDVKNTEHIKDKLVKDDKKTIMDIRKREIITLKTDKNFFFMLDNYVLIGNTNFSRYNLEYYEDVLTYKKILIDFWKSYNTSFMINDKLYHWSRNKVFTRVYPDDVVCNIENIKLEPCTDPIYLFQQFFIPKVKERYDEIKECLFRNVELGLFEKIYLLNERIYTSEELGVSDSSVVQIDIGKRLKYIDFIEHASKLEGFVVLSNSDIFFDKSITNIRKSIIRDTKSVQCLRRYEYRDQKNLDQCSIYFESKSSQDTWIFHTNYIDHNLDCDFHLGVPACDNRLATSLKEADYTLMASYEDIKTYHNHKNATGKYSHARLSRPYTLVMGSHPYSFVEREIEKTDIFWQYPVITEKMFFEQNKYVENYVGFPWATLLDKNIIPSSPSLLKLLTKKNSYTCCQHINFRHLIPYFKKIDLKTLYTPHKVIGEDSIEGILIKPCPLYAKVIEDRPEYFQERGKREDNSEYLYSFQGGHQNGYMSQIRQHIFKMKHPKNTFIKNTDDWHYNKIVYSDNQNKDGVINIPKSHQKNESDYGELLLKSVYTLCPSGTGPNSIRFWEALGAGSIPILLSDKLDLPHHPLMEETVLRVKEEQVHRIPLILKQISVEEIRVRKKNCYLIYDFFKNNYKGD